MRKWIKLLLNRVSKKIGTFMERRISKRPTFYRHIVVPITLLSLLSSRIFYIQGFKLWELTLTLIIFLTLFVVIIIILGYEEYSRKLRKDSSLKNVIAFLNMGKYGFLDRIAAILVISIILMYVICLPVIVFKLLREFMGLLIIPDEFLDTLYYFVPNWLCFSIIIVGYLGIKTHFKLNPREGILYSLMGLHYYLQKLVVETPTPQKVREEWNEMLTKKEVVEYFSNNEIERLKNFLDIIEKKRDISQDEEIDFLLTFIRLLVVAYWEHPLRVIESRETERYTIIVEEFYRYIKEYFSYFDPLLEEGGKLPDCIENIYLIMKYGNIEEKKELLSIFNWIIIFLAIDDIPRTIESIRKTKEIAPRLGKLKGIITTRFEKIKKRPQREPLISTSNLLRLILYFAALVLPPLILRLLGM